jgi:hypothetical protein
MNGFEKNGKIKIIRDLYRGINEVKRSYEPINDLIKDENGGLVADSDNILNRWKNCFFSKVSVMSGRYKYIQLNPVS